MINPKLQQILYSKKNPIAKAMLRDLFESDNFKLNMCKRLDKLVTEQRAKLGYDMTTEPGFWTWDDDALDEGLAGAIGNVFKRMATHSLATGLGVNPSSLHKFGSDLLHTKTPKAPTMKKVVAKPQHPSPSTASLHTSPIYHMVMPSDVHSKIAAFPGEHEDHLNAFINHHNQAMTAKEKGDKTGAAVHFRARNHALVRYQATAPKEHLKHLNTNKVQQMMSMNF